MKFFGYIEGSWILTLSYSRGKNVTEVGEGGFKIHYVSHLLTPLTLALCAPPSFFKIKDRNGLYTALYCLTIVQVFLCKKKLKILHICLSWCHSPLEQPESWAVFPNLWNKFWREHKFCLHARGNRSCNCVGRHRNMLCKFLRPRSSCDWCCLSSPGTCPRRWRLCK
jgi:hypothetical protein